MRDRPGAANATLAVMQPTGHLSGAEINFGTISRFDMVDGAGKTACAQGVETKAACAGGNLCVHLVNDFDANKNPRTFIIELAAGAQSKGYLFDIIYQTGTTVTLDANVDFLF